MFKYKEKLYDPEKGYGLLHLAAGAGDLDAVQYLLRGHQQGYVNLTFKVGQTFWQPPLYYALTNGHDTVFTHLLNNGADPFQRFRTDLVVPQREKWAEGSKISFLRGPRSTYLHLCPGNGSGLRFASVLLRQGLRIDCYDSNWESPLFLAIIACDFELADYLIGNGATNNVSDGLTILGRLAEDGFMAPYAAYDYALKLQAKYGPKGAAGFMSEYSSYRTYLHILIERWGILRNDSWTEALLDLFLCRLPNKELLDIQADGTGVTALMLAVKSMNVDATRKLLDWGADPDVPNYTDGTPSDAVLHMTYDRMSKHGIRFQDIKKGQTSSGSKPPLLEEVSKLEEIYGILDSYNGKLMRQLPPWSDEFKMSSSDHRAENQRREALGIDLRSINANIRTIDGPLQALCDDVETDIKARLGEDAVPEEIVYQEIVNVIGMHLAWFPEAGSSSDRLHQVQYYLAELVGQYGAVLHLRFDHLLREWRMELSVLPSEIQLHGISVLSPRNQSTVQSRQVAVLPEHEFYPARHKAEPNKMTLFDETAYLAFNISDPPLSLWNPPARKPPSTPTSKPNAAAGWLRARSKAAQQEQYADTLGPIGFLRRIALLPPSGYSIVVGPEDELASLFFHDQEPLPEGHRVMIKSLEFSDSVLSLTVGCVMDQLSLNATMSLTLCLGSRMDLHGSLLPGRSRMATTSLTKMRPCGSCSMDSADLRRRQQIGMISELGYLPA